MTRETRRRLELSLLVTPQPVLGVAGPVDQALDAVRLILNEGNRRYEVIDVASMPEIEQIHGLQAARTEIKGEGFDTSTVFQAFLAANEITQTPEVLILHNFNKRHPTATYFVKGMLLDLNARQADPSFDVLKQVVLVFDLDDPQAHPIDPGVRSCIWKVIPVTEENRANAEQ